MDEQDKLLPIANVGRIMKHILPLNAKISKEAKVTIQECASEFISFVTSEASDKCHKENRKTVNGDDICWALTSLGFDNYSEAMMRHLHRFREFERQRANIQSNKKSKGNSSNSSEEKDEEITTNIQPMKRSSTHSTTTAHSFEFEILEKKG